VTVIAVIAVLVVLLAALAVAGLWLAGVLRGELSTSSRHSSPLAGPRATSA
jgi:hypothetical protein